MFYVQKTLSANNKDSGSEHSMLSVTLNLLIFQEGKWSSKTGRRIAVFFLIHSMYGTGIAYQADKLLPQHKKLVRLLCELQNQRPSARICVLVHVRVNTVQVHCYQYWTYSVRQHCSSSIISKKVLTSTCRINICNRGCTATS